MNDLEWQTRKQRIDTRLRAIQPPWKIISYRDGLDLSALDCHAVEELPTANGPADYGLFVGGRSLGIIEAKKVTANPQNVLEQARRYAEGAFQGPGNWNGFKVPFLYATNGEIIWHLDTRPEKRVSQPIAQFHTAPALAELFAFDPKPAHAWLLDTPPERITRLADQLEERLAKARGQVDALTPSLLARAFSGQLVPQDPTDEPAGRPLEKIKAARKE